jgi:hypothetical protein
MSKPYREPQAYSDEPRPPIPLTPVDSTKIAAVGYDDATKTLAVTFKNGPGAFYHYPNVERSTYEAFVGAPSVGGYFNKHLNTLPFTKYPPAPAGAAATVAA